jgi:hypothetical protein
VEQDSDRGKGGSVCRGWSVSDLVLVDDKGICGIIIGSAGGAMRSKSIFFLISICDELSMVSCSRKGVVQAGEESFKTTVACFIFVPRHESQSLRLIVLVLQHIVWWLGLLGWDGWQSVFWR